MLSQKRGYLTFNVGERFNFLVIKEILDGKFARCLCDCGKEKIIRKYNLRNGTIKSCGCIHKKITSDANKTHGMSFTKTYNSWDAMIQRCTNKSHRAFKYYGGRGINVCNQWLFSFEAFLNDMGERPEGLTIDRIDVNGNYEPSNCRWANSETQNLNKRPRISYVVINGEKYESLKQASISLNVSMATISNWCAGKMKNGIKMPSKNNCYYIIC